MNTPGSTEHQALSRAVEGSSQTRPAAQAALGALGPQVLAFDALAEADRIAAWMRETLAHRCKRRGLVVAVSGGIDSSVCAALAVRALGPQRVFALLLPERESSARSTQRGQLLVDTLGVAHARVDITAALEALGCYAQRDDAVRSVFPAYADGWGCRLHIAGGVTAGINFFHLDVQAPDGSAQRARLPLRAYLQIVAATNFKQRVRKTLEYFHADRLHYAVTGTPNRLEYDQGFFVKQGDGAADIKPIAHLYKTQVYAMAQALGLPADICNAVPTTDTYPMTQGQDEFYFALPHAQMDLALWAFEHRCPATDLAAALGTEPRQAEQVYADIQAKRAVAAHLHASGWTLNEAAPSAAA